MTITMTVKNKNHYKMKIKKIKLENKNKTCISGLSKSSITSFSASVKWSHKNAHDHGFYNIFKLFDFRLITQEYNASLRSAYSDKVVENTSAAAAPRACA